MIDSSYKIDHDNPFLDLSQDKAKFFVDHLFKLPNTSKSLCFSPYHISPDEIYHLNEYCKKNNCRVDFVGGASVYGGKNIYANGTMTVLLIHKDDELPNFLSCLNLLNESES